MANFVGFLSGFLFGCLDWYILYRLFKTLVFRDEQKYSNKAKFYLAFFLVLKLLVFVLLYFIITTIKLNVIYFILGLTVSLIGMIIVLLKKNI